MDSSEKSRDYRHWRHIEGAVLDVYYENERSQTADCKAHADTWCIHSRKRDELFQRVCTAWIERTGKREYDFPYSTDHICTLYFKFRKRNQEELAAHYREINQESNRLF